MIHDLVVPQPLPHEIEAGYAGRTARLNGYSSVRALYKHLKARSVSVGDAPGTGNIELLARMCEMSTQAFVVGHTLLPANRAIASYMHDMPHGAPGSETLIRKSGTRVVSSVWRSCRACAAEDVGFHGVAYWRRDHQLAGIVFCSKHGQRLAVDDNKAAVFDAPTDIEMGGEPASSTCDANSRAVMDRFADISYALLERSRPFELRVVLAALAEQARALKFRRSVRGRDRKLSDHALATLPHSWLKQMFSLEPPTRPGQTPITAVDAVLTASTPSAQEAFVLAAALLFETADDALTHILRKERVGVPRRAEPVARRRKDVWDRTRVENIYVRHKGSRAAVAREMGIGLRTARVKFAALGLPNFRKGKKSDKLAEGFIEFVEGGDLSEICARRALEPATLLDMVRVCAMPSLKLVRRILVVSEREEAEAAPRPAANLQSHMST